MDWQDHEHLRWIRRIAMVLLVILFAVTLAHTTGHLTIRNPDVLGGLAAVTGMAHIGASVALYLSATQSDDPEDDDDAPCMGGQSNYAAEWNTGEYGMPTEQVLSAVGDVCEAIHKRHPGLVPTEYRRKDLRATPGDAIEAAQHVLWMSGRIASFLVEGRREKAMRWLGCMQGFAWAAGLMSIDELKASTRPNDAE